MYLAAPSADDPDGDQLTTAMETILRTDPNDPDSDGDGWPDGMEAAHFLNPLGLDPVAVQVLPLDVNFDLTMDAAAGEPGRRGAVLRLGPRG